MEYHSHITDRTMTISMQGQFTFSDNGTFRTILDELKDRALQNVSVDFSHVDFIDSAGLGMLLLLRDECEQHGISITLASASGQVEKIFMVSKFDQLFTLLR